MTKTLIPNHMIERTDFDQLARDNLALEALRLGVAEGAAQWGMGNGILDTYATAHATADYQEVDGEYTNGGDSQAGYTLVDRNLTVPNGMMIDMVMIFTNTPTTYTFKVCLENSSTSFDIKYSVAFDHAGGGWRTFTLPNPYTVPATGTYRLGIYTPHDRSLSAERIPISYVGGDAEGGGAAMTATTAGGPILRATQSGTSTGVRFDAVNRLFSNRVFGADLTTGKPTSVNTSYSASLDGDKAIDSDIGTWWYTGNIGPGTPNNWLVIDLGTPHAVSLYRIYKTGVDEGPKAWRLQGSNDNVNWTTVNDQTNTFIYKGWYENNFTNTTAYRYWRVYVYDNYRSDQATIFPEVELFEQAPADMTLLSDTFDTGTTPGTLRVYLLEKDVDPVTLDTDIQVHGSRDGGATWATGTLEQLITLSSGLRVLAADIDVSTQPDGQSAAYKITSANAKELEVHGAALTWS